MAFSLPITLCRQTDLTVLPAGAGQAGYTLAIGYVLCIAGSGGKGPAHDVLYDRQQQWVRAAMPPGHPMPSAGEIAALIRQDCQALFGGQPDKVTIASVEA